MSTPTAEQVKASRNRRKDRGEVRITPNDRWIPEKHAPEARRRMNEATKAIAAEYPSKSTDGETS